MNQKKAKSIRRTMKRLFGRDPREVVAQPKKPQRIVIPTLNGFKSATWTGQHALAPTCGRAEYQRLKRDEMRPRERGGRTLGPSRLYFPAALDAQRAAA